MLGIITGTIKPNKDVGQLMLKDTTERLKQYRESIDFFIDSEAFDKIIFCDNSHYEMKEFFDLQRKAETKGIMLELLSFQGDNQGVKTQGKGYGEGEIMEYVMNHSKLVKKEFFFVKITGRLKIDNIKKIVQKLNADRIYFNIPNHIRKDMYDTRVYAMPIEIFRRNFQGKYNLVMDDKGNFLEYVYTNTLIEGKIRVTNFPRYPRIVGVSGSNGTVYGYTEWKCKVKDILSLLNCYKIKA